MSATGRLLPRSRVELADYPVDAVWSNDGKQLLVGGGDGALLLLDVESGAPARSIGSHAGGVLALAWQKAGRLFASSGQDGAVLLWDARTLEPRTLHNAAEWSEQLAFSDNGRLLAVATGRTLRIFDDQGQSLHSFPGHAGSIAALAWRPKCAEVAAAGNGGARVHRLEGRTESRAYDWKGACLTAAWNPDGRILAAGMQDGSLHIWYIASGTQSQMQGYGSKVFATEWSSNGRHLATAAGEMLIVWNFAGKGPEGSSPLELRAHSDRISALKFRPGGSWLVSAARDRRVLLWRVGGEDTPQDAHLLPQECTWLRFTRDGARLAVGDAAGGVTVFDCAS
jgi:WD40 repeat protein